MPRSGHARLGRPAVVLLACLLAAFALLQLVPYGHDHSKPLTTKRVSLRPAAA